MKISTNYLGMDLKHPFVAGASPLANSLDSVKKLEDAGAAAIVMNSLFEEQILHHQSGVEEHILSHMDAFAEATSFFPGSLDFALGPDNYLAQLSKIKESVEIPVIASLNGVNLGTWTEYAKLMEQAGADAIELNLYYLPTHADMDCRQIEDRSVEVVQSVRGATKLPLSVKLSPFFTSLPNFANRLTMAGADGLVLFNRYYQPDIDIEELEMLPTLTLSNSSELNLRLRWLALLYSDQKANLAITGGVHKVEDAIKGIMAGASCVQMVSAILKCGPEAMSTIIDGVVQWMTEHEYESIDQLTGSMSYFHTANPQAIERANYMKILQSWKP